MLHGWSTRRDLALCQEISEECPNVIFSDATDPLALNIQCAKHPKEMSKPFYCWKSFWFQETTRAGITTVPDIFAGYVTNASACESKCLCQIILKAADYHCGSMGVPVIWSTSQPLKTRMSANCEQTNLPETVTASGNAIFLKITQLSSVSTIDPLSKFLANVPVHIFESQQGYNIHFSEFFKSKRDTLSYVNIGYGSTNIPNSYELMKTIFSELKNLEFLTIVQVDFETLPNQAVFAKKLKVFKLLITRLLTRLPDWLIDAENLEYLMLNGISNPSFSLNFPRLPKLTTFNFLSMSVKNFTIKFRDISTVLEQIDFTRSAIERFAEDTFEGLPNMKRLDLTTTKITVLSPIMKITTLTELYLAGPLPYPRLSATCKAPTPTDLTSRYLDRNFFRNFSQLSVLDLIGYANLTMPDDALMDLKGLKTLVLSCNGWLKVPNFATRICGLRKLYLDRNKFNTSDAIPLSAVNAWNQLDLLNLMYNPMQVVPTALFAMSPYLGNKAKQLIYFSTSLSEAGQSPCEMYKLHLSNLETDFIGTVMNKAQKTTCENEYNEIIHKMIGEMPREKQCPSLPEKAKNNNAG